MDQIQERLIEAGLTNARKAKLAMTRFKKKATAELLASNKEGDITDAMVARRQTQLFEEWGKELSDKAKKPPRVTRPKEVIQAEKTRRADRKAHRAQEIKIPILPDHIPEVDIPEWFAKPKLKKGKVSSYSLVNPFTKQRTLAERDGRKPLDLKRKEVARVTAENVNPATIPLSMIKPSQRDLAIQFNQERMRLNREKVAAKDRPDKSAFQAKERGRPRKLPKNIQWHKDHPKEAPEEESKRQRPEPEETKQETRAEETKEEERAEPKKRGRKQKHFSAEEVRAAKAASARKRYKEKKDEAEKAAEGKGLGDMIRTAKKALVHKAGVFGKKIARTADTVINGASNYSRPARDMIRRYGEDTITKMEVCRTPVQSAIATALNVVSMGEFEKNNPYDKLFHLFLKLTLGQKQITVEKNEVITIKDFQERPDTECQDVPLGNPITLNQLLERGRTQMGDDRYFRYDSAVNNCQDYIVNLLQASHLGDHSLYEFIKQDTKQLFKGLKKTRGIAHAVTDLGAKVNALTQGAGLGGGGDIHIDIGSHNGKNYHMSGDGLHQKDYVCQSVTFPSSYGIPAARKWLKENGYKSPKVDIEENTIRFRQLTPAAVKKQGFTEYRTKDIGKGIHLVLVYKKKMSGEAIGMPRLAKGSKEAKAHMDKLRAMRKKKGGSIEGEPIDRIGGGLYAGKGLYGGAGLYAGSGVGDESDSSSDEDEEPCPVKMVVHHHFHHPHSEGGAVLGIKHFDRKVAKVGKEAAKGALKKAIPMATTALGTAAGAYLGGPAGAQVGAAAGKAGGDQLAKMATKGLGLYAGSGVSSSPKRFAKGSQEAKDHMARIRAMRKS